MLQRSRVVLLVAVSHPSVHAELLGEPTNYCSFLLPSSSSRVKGLLKGAVVHEGQSACFSPSLVRFSADAEPVEWRIRHWAGDTHRRRLSLPLTGSQAHARVTRYIWKLILYCTVASRRATPRFLLLLLLLLLPFLLTRTVFLFFHRPNRVLPSSHASRSLRGKQRGQVPANLASFSLSNRISGLFLDGS
jgi:hypothetical protein